MKIKKYVFRALTTFKLEGEVTSLLQSSQGEVKTTERSGETYRRR